MTPLERAIHGTRKFRPHQWLQLCLDALRSNHDIHICMETYGYQDGLNYIGCLACIVCRYLCPDVPVDVVKRRMENQSHAFETTINQLRQGQVNAVILTTKYDGRWNLGNTFINEDLKVIEATITEMKADGK